MFKRLLHVKDVSLKVEAAMNNIHELRSYHQLRMYIQSERQVNTAIHYYEVVSEDLK